MLQLLENAYYEYNRSVNITDPVQFPKGYINRADQELIAFIAAIFAYGTVKQIHSTLEKIVMLMGENPVEFLTEVSPARLRKLTEGVYHRFYSDTDVYFLLLCLRKVLREQGCLQEIFPKVDKVGELKQSINVFHRTLMDNMLEVGRNSAGVRFMFPDVNKGSACKRTNLFLRWMVRKDKVDLGLWKNVKPMHLIIPLDTHIAKVGKNLGFTTRKQADWVMAEEITACLRTYSPEDPVKYDFALCHLGMERRSFA